MVFLKDHLTSTTQMLGQMLESQLLTLEILVRVVTFTGLMLVVMLVLHYKLVQTLTYQVSQQLTYLKAQIFTIQMLGQTQELLLLIQMTYLKDQLTFTSLMLGQMRESLLLILETLLKDLIFTTQMHVLMLVLLQVSLENLMLLLLVPSVEL